MPDDFNSDALNTLHAIDRKIDGVASRLDVHENDCKHRREKADAAISRLSGKIEQLAAWRAKTEYVLIVLIGVMLISYLFGWEGVAEAIHLVGIPGGGK